MLDAVASLIGWKYELASAGILSSIWLSIPIPVVYAVGLKSSSFLKMAQQLISLAEDVDDMVVLAVSYQSLGRSNGVADVSAA